MMTEIVQVSVYFGGGVVTGIVVAKIVISKVAKGKTGVILLGVIAMGAYNFITIPILEWLMGK